MPIKPASDPQVGQIMGIVIIIFIILASMFVYTIWDKYYEFPKKNKPAKTEETKPQFNDLEKEKLIGY